MIYFTNGKESAKSEIFSFSTRSRDCTSVYCNQGTCDETTLKCDCDFGWNGDDCSIPPETNNGLLCYQILNVKMPDNTTTIIIAAVVGGGGGLLACIALITAAILVQKRRKRIRLVMPDFTKFMFSPGFVV